MGADEEVEDAHEEEVPSEDSAVRLVCAGRLELNQGVATPHGRVVPFILGPAVH